jgi:hypothetical protein
MSVQATGTSPPPVQTSRAARRGRLVAVLGLTAAVVVAAVVASVWWTGVTGSGGMSGVWADGGPADVRVSRVGENLQIVDVSRREVEVSFQIGHRGIWPVQVIDVWDTTDPDRQLFCGLQAHSVTGAVSATGSGRAASSVRRTCLASTSRRCGGLTTFT